MELPVPAAVARFVQGGGRDIDTTKLDPALQAKLPTAGTQIRLVDDGERELALAIADPDNQRLRVLATPSDGFTKIDGALLALRVERALAFRTQLGLTGPDHAYRLIHGAGDGLPGFSCDVLGRTAVVYVYAEALRALARQLGDAIAGFAKLDGAVVKLRARTSGDGSEKVAQDIVGKSPPEQLVVTEHGVPYEVHPLGGLNHGLFTDMREHRRGLSRFANGARVLNLFSYTGALSVACARAGARTVTSVDTSPGVAAWARGNFGRSNLVDDTRFRFETGDAVRYLQRAIKDKERYDLVVIDPPTFSTARGTPWSLERDYPDLIAKAASVIPPGGILWLAANTYELGSLAKLAHKGLRDRSAAIVEQGGLPPEYPTLVAQPHDRYLQVVVLRLG